jgi:RNA polymerase sigma-70 factor (ECF subfamily)
LEQAYRDLAPDLWRAVFLYAGGVREVADEAVAEAFAQAGADMGQIRDLRPWLYTVAFRIARKELKHRRHSRLNVGIAVSSTASPDTAGTEEILDLIRGLRHLSPTQRAVCVLRDVYGYSAAETGRMLRISEVAARVHLHGAHRRLRYHLREADVL